MGRYMAIMLVAVPAPALGQAMDHAHHHHPEPATASDAVAGTDQPAGDAAPPPVAHDLPAARYWDPQAMAAAAEAEMHPPPQVYSRLTFDLAERQFRQGRDGYRWEAEGWVGDVDRLVVRSKGEGSFGDRLDHAELQALYSKALDPWWNLQAGVRQDLQHGPDPTWAALGVEGRAPYQFDVQGAAFVSTKGQLAARIEGSYDQRITRRLVLQPRFELNLSAQDLPTQRIGSGLSSAEIGLRLRYEIRREFAPYLGVNWTRSTGRTADYARADGNGASERSVVAGIRFWL